MQNVLFAKNLAEHVKKMARDHGVPPEQIRRLTYKEVPRFYAKDVKMPKGKIDAG